MAFDLTGSIKRPESGTLLATYRAAALGALALLWLSACPALRDNPVIPGPDAGMASDADAGDDAGTAVDAGDAGRRPTGGSSAIGGACDTNGDCHPIAGGAFCFTQGDALALGLLAPGGYCTSETCDQASPSVTCGAGTICGALLGATGLPKFCESACQSNSDCRTGYLCMSGGCVFAPAPDAGTMTSDGGPGDGGQPGDGGLDGGSCGGQGLSCCASPASPCNSSSLVCEGNICQPIANGETGYPCQHNADCPSNSCLAVGQPTNLGNGWTGNVCTTGCSTDADCVAGWTCGILAGSGARVCQCQYMPETCNGKDDDCDGIIDNEPATDQSCVSNSGPQFQCRNGTCACAEALCNGQCINMTTDSNNCGGCGVACPSGSTCQSSHCVCTGGLTLCGSTCRNTSNDSSNCGGCGMTCGSGLSCSGGACSTQCTIYSTSGWQTCGNFVGTQGQSVTMIANGSWTTTSFDVVYTGPAGTSVNPSDFGDYRYDTQYNYGALLWQVQGSDVDDAFSSNTVSTTLAVGGALAFRINDDDSDLSNNAGSMSVTIQVSP
jgi:hypothetical protein